MGNARNKKRNHYKELKFLRGRGWFRIGMSWFVSERLGRFSSSFKSQRANAFGKKIMKPSLFCVLLFLMLVSVSRAAEKPLNILIIYADDLGFGDLQCYNPDSKIPTPNLNALASTGMKY